MIATLKLGFGKNRLTSTSSKQNRIDGSELTNPQPAQYIKGSEVRIPLDLQQPPVGKHLLPAGGSFFSASHLAGAVAPTPAISCRSANAQCARIYSSRARLRRTGSASGPSNAAAGGRDAAGPRGVMSGFRNPWPLPTSTVSRHQPPTRHHWPSSHQRY